MDSKKAKFSIGYVVKHRHFNFRGVIYAVAFDFNYSGKFKRVSSEKGTVTTVSRKTPESAFHFKNSSFSPKFFIASAVAKKLKEEVITSSPIPISSDLSARTNASVPLLQPTT